MYFGFVLRSLGPSRQPINPIDFQISNVLRGSRSRDTGASRRAPRFAVRRPLRVATERPAPADFDCPDANVRPAAALVPRLLTRFAVRVLARFAPALRLVRLLAMKQSYSYLCHKSMEPAHVCTSLHPQPRMPPPKRPGRAPLRSKWFAPLSATYLLARKRLSKVPASVHQPSSVSQVMSPRPR